MRQSWDEHFLGLAVFIGQSRGTCDRGKCGAVAVKDKNIIATGYVGAVSGQPHCDDVGHQFAIVDGKNRCIRTIHAEQNLLVSSSKHGTSLTGSTVYSTMEPCFVCAKLLAAVGIKRFVAAKAYHASSLSKSLFDKVGIIHETLDSDVIDYAKLPSFVGMFNLETSNLSTQSIDEYTYSEEKECNKWTCYCND